MRSSSKGKTRRTVSEWQAILNRFGKSGLGISAFCERESIGLEAFRRWRHKLAARPVQDSPAFVPLTRDEGFPAFWSLEIDLPDGRTVRIRG